MESYFSLRPLLAVAVSLAAAVLIVASANRPNIREAWSFAASLAKFGIIASMIPLVADGRYPEIALFDIAPGVALAFRADPLGLIFALSASLLWIATSMYSIGYMRGVAEQQQTRYYASFAVCLSATIGIAFAANLLTFLIFYEVLTIATYPLVVHKGTPEAIEAGRKYLVYLLTGGVAMLGAVAWTWTMAPSLDFKPGGILPSSGGAAELTLLLLLFVAGLGVKAGLMPLHAWLPSAMVAPTPVSALLHAVAVVKAGVFGLARVIGFVFGPELLSEITGAGVITAAAAVTIAFASLLALAQDNLKRRLAYSTISHLSYIVLGLGLLTPEAWGGALLHIVTHAAMKITLFFCAGAIYVKTHLENVSELDGLGKQMPITLGAFAVASLGLAGIPPLGGFLSKWFLAQGTITAQEPLMLIVLLASGLFNVAYLFPVVVRGFFKTSAKFSKFDEASSLLVVPILTTALLAIMLGWFPDLWLRWYTLVTQATVGIFEGG
jgi:multicomponent Na+:H+ antiporter subunit D